MAAGWSASGPGGYQHADSRRCRDLHGVQQLHRYSAGTGRGGRPDDLQRQRFLGAVRCLHDGRWTETRAGPDHDDADREFAYASEAGTIADAEPITDIGRRSGWVVVSMQRDWETVFRAEQRPG